MKLGYYQIFWNVFGVNTFEYRYNLEVDALRKQGVIKSFTLINFVNQDNDFIETPDGKQYQCSIKSDTEI